MKKLCLLLFVNLFFLILKAQQIKQPNSEKDKIEFGGYRIELIPIFNGTYGYKIMQGKDLIVYYDKNPFTMGPVGFNKKEDAHKLAKWQIEQLRNSGSPGIINKTVLKGSSIDKLPPNLKQKIEKKELLTSKAWINQPIDRKIAKELQISI